MKGAMIARSPTDWHAKDRQDEPWQHALREVVTSSDELLALLDLADEAPALDRRPAFPLRVPRSFVARMRRGERDDPLLRQVLPALAETQTQPGFVDDPLDESEANKLPGLIHKYAGRVLLVLSGNCAINCRYCFRRHFPYADNRPPRAEWAPVFDYIERDPSLHEVILSGGDPLSLSDRRLAEMVDRLAAIAHLRRLRVHSRLPVVVPQRVTPALVELLTGSRLATSLVIHANHPREIDQTVGTALRPLRTAGLSLLNQSVLLAGVNDHADTLTELSERLFAVGVLPYYVHLLDRVSGAAHFDVPEAHARALHAALLARLPGYLVPRFVRAVAHAASKIPLGPALAQTT